MNPRIALPLFFLLSSTIACNFKAPSQPDITEPQLLSVTRIWDAAPHNAFTSLARLNDTWFCAFRESSAHVPGTDGKIRVLRSADGAKWESAALLAEAGVDLRDPMITATPDNRLMLLMGGSIYSGRDGDPKRTRTGGRSRVAFSSDAGATWSTTTPVALESLWLWRVTWHKGAAYGAAYGPTNPRSLSLWRTDDGQAYKKVTDLNPPASPSETTVRFLPDDTMVMLVRGEPGNKPAVVGTSRAPYTEWTWHDLGRPIQGPDFIILPDGRMYYGGRDFDEKKPKTVFGQLTPTSATPLITLPSGGDTSYPGLAMTGPNELLMTYYASHEGKSAIYAARIALPRK